MANLLELDLSAGAKAELRACVADGLRSGITAAAGIALLIDLKDAGDELFRFMAMLHSSTASDPGGAARLKALCAGQTTASLWMHAERLAMALERLPSGEGLKHLAPLPPGSFRLALVRAETATDGGQQKVSVIYATLPLPE